MSTWKPALVLCAFGTFSFCAALYAVCEVGLLQEVCSSLTASNKLDSSVIILSVLLIFLGVWAVGLPSNQVTPSILCRYIVMVFSIHNIGVALQGSLLFLKKIPIFLTLCVPNPSSCPYMTCYLPKTHFRSYLPKTSFPRFSEKKLI